MLRGSRRGQQLQLQDLSQTPRLSRILTWLGIPFSLPKTSSFVPRFSAENIAFNNYEHIQVKDTISVQQISKGSRPSSLRDAMNGTPRMQSSFPSTPGSGRRSTGATSAEDGLRLRSPLPNLPQATTAASLANTPLIPVNLVDAPSQRMYAVAVYVFLLAWRLYDWSGLIEDDTESFWLFLKWIAIDAGFLFGVPELRIPWLEWSHPVVTGLFVLHAVFNGMLMFRIPLPIEGPLIFLTKTLYDREISISEKRVKPANILHNSSLIMGKQIINILPEGSATMNPDRVPFCVDNSHPSVKIPIHFNETIPMHIELLRIDLDTNSNETIQLKKRELKAFKKLASKSNGDPGMNVLDFVVKKPGLYRLFKIIDQSKLEVQRRMSDTLVVTCPKAVVKSDVANKCIGDLSDLTIEVEGTPPLKIVYSRTVNKEDTSFHFQSIQPENFASPLLGTTSAGPLVVAGSQDVSWARPQKVVVRLNESMTTGGKWLYSIDEIHDATGNVANFSARGEDGEHIYPKDSSLEHGFVIHERPHVRLAGCDSRNPIMVANRKSASLPIKLGSPGRTIDDASHIVTWKFSPLNSLTSSGDHGEESTVQDFTAKNMQSKPYIREAGLYTLTGVKNNFCEGEVQEPASCLLINPPEPELTISAENIHDKCAGNSIGLLVDLNLIGTPPFTVRYDITTRGRTQYEQVEVSGLRHQLELKPKDAGHFTYRFTSMDDHVYKAHPLTSSKLMLEQDVKPPASASLKHQNTVISACIEEPVKMEVQLSGERPFALEYELIHDGKRKKDRVTGIESDVYMIKTEPLINGGEYTLALVSVQDKTGCKIFLNGEAKVSVRRQRPRASFGQLDGKYQTLTVEGKKIPLPLRLTGVPPWSVRYRNTNDEDSNIIEKTAQYNNDVINVDHSGQYEIVDVHDDQCPGTVDQKASKFLVDWLPRPQIKVANTAVTVPDGERYQKREVCEADVDTVEVNLTGFPPYHVEYQIRHKPEHGSGSINNKAFDAGLGLATIAMDTSRAGKYEYRFTELSDNVYDHDSKRFTPLVIEQRVYQKPSAYFTKPGQSYKYCKEESGGNEVIPITLEGQPPFHLEVDIKHQNSIRPTTLTYANIDSMHYNVKIPHETLSLGVHQVSVRKVRDAHGCQKKTEYGAPHVQVQVYDVPTINELESRTDYCVGDRISYTLSGTAPFEIFYTFEGVQRKAKSQNTNFKRIAEKPGTFTITAVSDKASECKATTSIKKVIHEMPSVKISKGRQVEVDIHEGGEAELLFEFWGTPPFEFTYTRSTNARKGHKSQVLETRHEVSSEYSKIIQSSQEGTYEVVAIKDAYCSFSTHRAEAKRGGQKLLQL
ncbi:hypothetical protein PVAG01_02974 [Phlyctema vagabunda]|uniref:Nucleoporin Pom152 n=1 Tax=Phlyctema vagabunda TaxID=108571 RepID=A0ABR4PS30_9HELO